MNRTCTLLLSLLVLPQLALAQTEGRAPSRDKEAVTFKEIERGFFMGLSGGWLFFMNPPSSGSNRPFSPGQMAQVEVGMELGERIAVSGFLMGSANRAGADYTGMSNGTASGDFSALVPGGAVRVNALGFNDAQDVKRTWLYVRGGAGFVLFSPKALLPDPDVMVFAGPGVEYFTRLRHFSIGLEATGSFLVSSGTVGFSLTPNLRYAF
jgi:hypothetical protein